MLLLFGVEGRLGTDGFQLFLPPALLVLVGDVHVLRADGAAVGLAKGVEQIAQGHDFLAEKCVAGVEHRFEVGVGKPVKRWVQLGNVVALGAFEGVEIGPAGTHVAVGSDQLLYGNALAAQVGIGAGGDDHLGAALFGALCEGIDNGEVRHVAGIGAVDCGDILERIEVAAPVFGHATGIFQVVFVHLLHVGGIAAKQVGVVVVGNIDVAPIRLGIAHESADLRFPWGNISWLKKPSATRLNRLADATVTVEGPDCNRRLCHRNERSGRKTGLWGRHAEGNQPFCRATCNTNPTARPIGWLRKPLLAKASGKRAQSWVRPSRLRSGCTRFDTA